MIKKHFREKSSQVALLSLLSTSMRVLVGPITLLIIAGQLNESELGFYYMFFSLIAMRQLLELGMSNVLRQFYAHELKDGLHIVNKKVCHLIVFSIKWYSVISLLFCIVSYIIGYVIFNRAVAEVDWSVAWTFLVLTTFLNIMLMPIKAYLDGMQHQKLLYVLTIASDFGAVLSLWLLLTLDYKLISLGVSQLIGVFIFIYFTYLYKENFIIKNFSLDGYSFKVVFKELWPLLKKTSVVWFLGYFYWNGFNIISFEILGPAVAGLIGLSISMARAGQKIAMSIVMSNMTIYGKLIANKLYKKSFFKFLYHYLSGGVILIIGYVSFLLIWNVMPEFYLFDKVIGIDGFIWLILFFIVVYLNSGLDNYTRCYKLERFVFVQGVNSILTPLAFYFSIQLELPYFYLPSIVLVFILAWTVFIFLEVVQVSELKDYY